MVINIHLSNALKILVQGTAVNKADCRKEHTNHSITLVGYEPGSWIVLNSWAKNLKIKDHTFFKLPWGKHFTFDEDGSRCFCGGIGDDCTAILLIHKDYNPEVHKKIMDKKARLIKSLSENYKKINQKR